MELTSDNVEKVFMDCLFKDEEDTSDHIVAEGIQSKVGFHPARLQGHREDVRAMIRSLPEGFFSDKGGGASFLNACNDKKGEQWTGLHKRIEQLFQLGIGLKLAVYLTPRPMWSSLPGGMPYIVINLDRRTEK